MAFRMVFIKHAIIAYFLPSFPFYFVIMLLHNYSLLLYTKGKLSSVLVHLV